MRLGIALPLAMAGGLVVGGRALAADPITTAALVTGSGGTASASQEDLKMKALENEIDVLKEKVFSSKARLLQLQEVTLHGAAAGAIARIHFKNDMGGGYRLESATWVLDGQTIFAGTAAPAPDAAKPAAPIPEPNGLLKTPEPSIAAVGAIDEKRELTLFDGAIVPGSHNLTVTLVYRGAGYQVFTYTEGYRFTVQSSYAFLVDEGKTTELTVIAAPKTELIHGYEDRLDLKFALSSKDSILPQAETRP